MTRTAGRNVYVPPHLLLQLLPLLHLLLLLLLQLLLLQLLLLLILFLHQHRRSSRPGAVCSAAQ